MILATKSPSGDTVVYSVPARPDATVVRTVRRIGSFQVPAADGPFGGGSLFSLLVTGAAVSSSGDRFVVRTYTNAYVWALKSGGIAAALRSTPVRIVLPAQPQGEGVTFEGTQLLIDSEGEGSAVWSVPLPARPSATVATSTGTGTTTPAVQASPSPVSASPTRSGTTHTAEILGLGAAVVLIGGGWAYLRARRGSRT
jgi:hypothetical protein